MRESSTATYYAFPDGCGGTLRLCEECARKEIHGHGADGILALRRAEEELAPGEEVPCDGCDTRMANEGRELAPTEPEHAEDR